MRACLEYMAITEVETLDDALDVVTAVDHPAGGILVDPFHHERVGHDPEKIGEIPPRWLSYAQLCDMPACGVVTDPDAYYIDAIDGRLAPGEGSVPVAAMAKAASQLADQPGNPLAVLSRDISQPTRTRARNFFANPGVFCRARGVTATAGSLPYQTARRFIAIFIYYGLLLSRLVGIRLRPP